MSRRKNLSNSDDQIEINISPMIDMVFILLIFFIVTTVFVEEEGFMADTPDISASQPQNKDALGPVIIKINERGTITLDNREIRRSQISIEVSNQMRREERPVIIKVHNALPSEHMVMAMDEARRGNADTISVTSIDQ